MNNRNQLSFSAFTLMSLALMGSTQCQADGDLIAACVDKRDNSVLAAAYVQDSGSDVVDRVMVLNQQYQIDGRVTGSDTLPLAIQEVDQGDGESSPRILNFSFNGNEELPAWQLGMMLQEGKPMAGLLKGEVILNDLEVVCGYAKDIAELTESTKSEKDLDYQEALEAMIAAVEAGDVDKARRLLEGKFKLDGKLVALDPNEEADINSGDALYKLIDDRTGSDNAEMARLLINHPEMKLGQPNHSGWTPLVYAAYVGRVEITKVLLEEKERQAAAEAAGEVVAAERKIEFEARGSNGTKLVSALAMARKKGHSEIAELLKAAGAPEPK